MQKTTPIALFAAILGLSACSQGTDIERAAVGGLAGCVLADAIDEGECIPGALLGGVAGALADDF